MREPLISKYRFLLMLSLILVILVMATMPMAAQDSPSVFATNTPMPTQRPILTPDAPFDNYALRLWLDHDLMALLNDSLARLSNGDSGAQLAVQLTQYELQRRFPNAPEHLDDRETLMDAMLMAPRGTVDMRWIIRPLVEYAVNQNPILTTMEYRNMSIELTQADVDGIEPIDAMIHIVYPSGATDPSQVLYEDYVLATASANGVYNIIDASPDYPAAPFSDIKQVDFNRIEDVNNDGLDELVLIVDKGETNLTMLIMGYRNGIIQSLVNPAEQILLGEIVDWPTGNPEIPDPMLEVIRYQLESPEWQCLSELPVQWKYQANLYRSSVEMNTSFDHQKTLACMLYEAEPLFELPASEAIELIETAVAGYTMDTPGYARAMMTRAMLFALNGQPTDALDLAIQLQAESGDNFWLSNQSSTFISLLTASGNTVLDICEGLVIANMDGACDMDAVLGQIFRARPLLVGEPVIEQLQSMGLQVLESTVIREVGKVDRVAVSLNLFGTGWWGFAALGGDSYTAEPIEAPAGFEAAVFPLGFIQTPQKAYDALFIDNAPSGAIAVLDTVITNNPNVPLSPEARYIQALSYDLVGDRIRARQGYFALWSAYPDNIWGQLSRQHLERR